MQTFYFLSYQFHPGQITSYSFHTESVCFPRRQFESIENTKKHLDPASADKNVLVENKLMSEIFKTIEGIKV
jgi:hypothetical protein